MTDRPGKFRIRSAVLVIAVIALLTAVLLYWRSGAGLSPRSAPTLNFPTENPFSGAWSTVDAFPGVSFSEPMSVVQVPGENRYLVAQKNGLVLSVTAGASARAEAILDLTAKTVNRSEAGLVGLALHPGFAQAGSAHAGVFYVFYVNDTGGRLYDRLSSFTITREGRVDPAAERVLIDQLDEDTDHNSGQLQFGPDGYLYVGVGDEGGIGDQFQNGQRIDKDLFSGILRIDVDCGASSRPIAKQPRSGRTQGYCIPRDNPFVDQPGALGEFWAIGLRNPHRFSFDTTGLWGGDVGQDRREEVFVARAGSNHQWSYREGSMPFPEGPFGGQRPERPIGTEQEAVFQYPHTDQNGAIIGGYVYRGKRFPELLGRYVFGDYNSGRIWALESPMLAPAGASVVSRVEVLLRLPTDQRIAAFGMDAEGELFLCVHGRRSSILRLSRRENETAP
jgi:glucose/arabinose dehydrogenase